MFYGSCVPLKGPRCMDSFTPSNLLSDGMKESTSALSHDKPCDCTFKRGSGSTHTDQYFTEQAALSLPKYPCYQLGAL